MLKYLPINIKRRESPKLISEGIKVNRTLIHLDINLNDIEAEDAEDIGEAFKAKKSIRKFSLSGSSLESEDGKLIEKVLRSSKALLELYTNW